MSKIIRYQFMGNTVLFWLLCVTGFLIPIAVLYLVNGTLRIEHEVEHPEQFIEDYKKGKIKT